jgi:hypothetical protein
MKLRTLGTILVALCILFCAPAAKAEWHFGIGTGFIFLNAQGDEGFHTDIAGPVEVDVDLDPDDFADFTQSAFGFGGYATEGTWLIKYSFGILKLGGDADRTLANGTTIDAELDYDITNGELLVGYPVFSSENFTLRVEGGLRYIRHDISLDLTVNTTDLDRDIDEGWTDFLLGLSLSVPFSQKWSWDSHANGGYGGSEGTYAAKTGITWRFLKHWSAGLYGQYTAIEFENGSKGDDDWYLYDTNEYGIGINVLFNW